MTLRKIGTTVGPPATLAVIFGAVAVALTARVAPLYEARVRLESAPVPLVREFNAAVDGRATPRAAANDPLERRDVRELGLAAHDARLILAGSARTTGLTVQLDGEP